MQKTTGIGNGVLASLREAQRNVQQAELDLNSDVTLNGGSKDVVQNGVEDASFPPVWVPIMETSSVIKQQLRRSFKALKVKNGDSLHKKLRAYESFCVSMVKVSKAVKQFRRSVDYNLSDVKHMVSDRRIRYADFFFESLARSISRETVLPIEEARVVVFRAKAKCYDNLLDDVTRNASGDYGAFDYEPGWVIDFVSARMRYFELPSGSSTPDTEQIH